MNLFRLIWDASLLLAVASIVTLLFLIVRRLIIQYRTKRREARRAVLQDAVYSYLSDPDSVFQKRPGAADQRILLALVTEMMRSVSGEMNDHLVDLLERTIDQDRMARAVRTASPYDRAKFAARLSWSRSPAVHAALRAALDDPEPPVVLAAANSLIAAKQNLSLVDLVPRLERRKMLGHRAVRDLFRKLAPQNSAALVVLLDDPNPAVAVLSADALARVPSPVALKRLADLALNHASVDVRAAAIRTIGLVGDAATKPIVLAALKDPAWEVAAQAAIGAGRMRLTEAIDVLAMLLRSPNWWVQLRAAQALAKLGDRATALLEEVRLDMQLGSIADFALSERHLG